MYIRIYIYMVIIHMSNAIFFVKFNPTRSRAVPATTVRVQITRETQQRIITGQLCNVIFTGLYIIIHYNVRLQYNNNKNNNILSNSTRSLFAVFACLSYLTKTNSIGTVVLKVYIYMYIYMYNIRLHIVMWRFANGIPRVFSSKIYSAQWWS